MRKTQTLAIALLLLASLSGILFYHSKRFTDLNTSAVAEVTWAELKEKGGEANLNKRVKISGFIVPLSDGVDQLHEFLIVPDATACIHAPPPPTNQMILVEIEEPIKTQIAFGPVWVFGTISRTINITVYGEVSFQMKADRVWPFEEKRWSRN